MDMMIITTPPHPSSRAERIFTSPLFTFYVGEEQTPMMIHQEALMDLSDVFKEMMIDNKFKSASLPYVSVADFVLLSEYAYRGDYTPPRYTVVPPTGNMEEENMEEENMEEETKSSPKPKVKLPPRPETKLLWTTTATNFPIFGPPKDTSMLNSPQATNKMKQSEAVLSPFGSTGTVPNTNSRQDCTEIFLSHARIYVLAKKTKMVLLEQLALGKLHDALVHFTMFGPRVGDIIAFIQYAFNEDCKELKIIAIKYVYAMLDVLGESLIFENHMAKGGNFAVAYMQESRKYVPKFLFRDDQGMLQLLPL